MSSSDPKATKAASELAYKTVVEPKEVLRPKSVRLCCGCQKIDLAEDMMACDTCSSWYHFECMERGVSINNRSFRCAGCTKPASCPSFASSKSSSSARLRLKQLEEAKALEDRLLQEKAEKEREYLAAKHQIETELAAESSVSGSERSSVKSSIRSESVARWVITHQNQQEEEALQKETPADPKTSTPITSSTTVVTPNVTTSQPLPQTSSTSSVVTSGLQHLPDSPLERPVPEVTQTVGNSLPTVSFSVAPPQTSRPPVTNPVYTQQTIAYPYGQLHPTVPPNNTLPTPWMYASLLQQPHLPQYSVAATTGHQGHHLPNPSLQNPPLYPTSMSGLREPTISAPPRATVQTFIPGQPINSAWNHQEQQARQQSYLSQSRQSDYPGQSPMSNHVQSQQQRHSSGTQGRGNVTPQSNRQPVYRQSEADAVINSQQLAARYVVSRDLPKFSGDPMEWPMFLSAFESTTAMCGIQPDENLARLQKSLTGAAREKVLSILTLPAAVPEIIEILRDECGRPEQLVHCLLTKIRNMPHPNINKLDTLVTFGREVKNLVTFIEAANLQAHLSNPMLLTELVGKLPPSLRLDWGLTAQDLPEVSLQAFSEFVTAIKTAACHVSLNFETPQSTEDTLRGTRKKERGNFVNAHNTEDNKPFVPKPTITASAPKTCSACNKTEHKLRDCETFVGYNCEEKKKFVDQHKLCQRCLTGHGKWPCRTKQPCGVNGCTGMHHKLLHQEARTSMTSPKPGPSGLVSTHRNNSNSTLFRILPVTLKSGEKSISTFAFLDDGSSLTLVENEIAEELGLHGEESPLCLQWTGNVTRQESSSRRVKLDISNQDNGKQYTLSNVRTVTTLGLPKQSLDYQELSRRFVHLRGLPVRSFSNAVPRILIGLDNARLNLTLAKRERESDEPVAAKTKLGWTIFGASPESDNVPHVMVHTCNDFNDQSLHDLVKEHFAEENMGISGTAPPDSGEVQRARNILRETTKRTESGRYETGLLWASDDVELPSSYHMAERRLGCLERRLQREPNLKAKVEEQISEYQRLGYIHKATEAELKNSEHRRVWYLPLGVVRNPQKPNKVRIVWDAAARVGNVSLNSVLLAGPDLLTPLLAVLFRFRQRQIAVSGDIRQMFHQLLIREADRQVQRFLWRSDPDAAPEIYVMDVATFGATCSPTSAQYVKNVNASEFAAKFPEAAAAIIHNTYVDDYLDSRDTIEEAARVASEVHAINLEAGFEVRNWRSNSVEVLKRVGVNEVDTVKNFAAEKSTPAERVLGMSWVTDDDIFVFSPNFREDLLPLMTGVIVPTKRQVLRVVMSFFDPLGLITTYTIHGRILIQDIWRSAVQWDDPITEENFAKWKRWVSLSSQLSRVKVPRCYFPNYEPSSYESIQLHVFVDASELAYSCVAYLRITDRGSPRCALVGAKAKVTPLKPQSIPRNELNAGVIGVRLMKTIVKNHTIPIAKRFIWTDSTTVLCWLQADPRKYRQYVAFRVSEILEGSELNEWRWVPTRMNVADEATKWSGGPSFDPDSNWFKGPDFLHLPENQWPARRHILVDPVEELRTVNIHHEATSDTLLDFTRFSKYKSLLKTLAYVCSVVRCVRTGQWIAAKSTGVLLNQEDYENAEKLLWRTVQSQEFSKEIAILKENSTKPFRGRRLLEKSNPLAKLSAFVDEDGVLRMQSRVDPDAAYYSYNFRNPIILPKQHQVTDLLVLRYHHRYAHANTETVVNELRQIYYIPKLRSVVKKAIKLCAWCRVYRASPQEPKMAALPQPRVQPYVRPFTFTGLDYFGPLVVKRGRSNVKRWVALFTCLTVRAVHLEVVHSLSTRSCRMAIRRFITYRGSPQEIFSDNGTNFRGAAREMAEECRRINRALAPRFVNAETKWNFNPPAAPHMGGVWERKVRSVKEAFKTLTHREKLDDEELVTLLAEVENIVNSHPLTFVPLESPNAEVLTPNSFILMSSGGNSCAPRVPVDTEVSLNFNWKVMEELLNQFWKRWIQAYLPTIARRTKWFADVRPLQEGDVVAIVDEGVRNGWLRGRVIKAYPGSDGQVRRVDVQTDSGVLRRPAIKVALLDVLDAGKAI